MEAYKSIRLAALYMQHGVDRAAGDPSFAEVARRNIGCDGNMLKS
jgi:hypothetical protein